MSEPIIVTAAIVGYKFKISLTISILCSSEISGPNTTIGERQTPLKIAAGRERVMITLLGVGLSIT